MQEAEPADAPTEQQDRFGHDAESVGTSSAKHFKTLLSVQEWAVQMPAEWQDIYDFSVQNFIEQSDFISIDAADIKVILPAQDGVDSVLLFKYEGTWDEIVRYIEKSHDFDGAVSALFFLSGPFEPLSLDSLNTVANNIQGHCSPDAIIIFGCRLNEEMSLEHICLYVLATLPPFQYKGSDNEAPDENDQFPLSLF